MNLEDSESDSFFLCGEFRVRFWRGLSCSDWVHTPRTLLYNIGVILGLYCGYIGVVLGAPVWVSSLARFSPRMAKQELHRMAYLDPPM